MNGSRSVTALAAALVLPLGLAACGSDEETPAASTATTSAAETSTPTEEPTDEATTTTPTDTPDAEPGLGDWCTALEESADDVTAILPDEGEWTTRPAETFPPDGEAAFTERVGCSLRLGEGLEALIVGVTESQYEDEATAGAELAALRDDTDPMAATENVDFGDEAIYTTYNGQMGMPPFVSFSVTLREADRLVRVSIRDHATEPPPDEQARRDQVIEVVEALQGG